MMHFLDYSRTEKSPIFNCYLNFLQIPNGFLVTIYAHYIGFKIQPHKKSESSKKKKKISLLPITHESQDIWGENIC